jgi:tetratricopeptide (TPR) repeat protein
MIGIKKKLIAAAAISVAVMGLILAVRWDLGRIYGLGGLERLASGDPLGALVSLERASELLGGSSAAEFNRGIALYRLGRYREARGRFAAACGARDAAVRAAALYNSANCAFRQGELVAGKNRKGGESLFREAVSGYAKAIALDPARADAKHNLILAERRLAVLSGGGEKKTDNGGKKTAAPNEKPEADKSRKASAEKTGAQVAGASSPASADTGAASMAGKKRTQLTRENADRLLSEARGRESLLTTRPALGPGVSSRPEKDW